DNNGDDDDNPPPPPGASCSFDGTWQRCIPNGANSTRETLRVNGPVLEQTVETFIGSKDCEGIPGLILPVVNDIQLHLVSQTLHALGLRNIDIVNVNLDLG